MVRRGPFLIRLARATRRGATTYWAEIRKARLNPIEHIGAVGLILFVITVALTIASQFLWVLMMRISGA